MTKRALDTLSRALQPHSECFIEVLKHSVLSHAAAGMALGSFEPGIVLTAERGVNLHPVRAGANWRAWSVWEVCRGGRGVRRGSSGRQLDSWAFTNTRSIVTREEGRETEAKIQDLDGGVSENMSRSADIKRATAG